VRVMPGTSARAIVARPARTWLPAVGWLALAACAASVIALPSGWLSIGLAGLATVGLAADRRLGWLPAALLVSITLPFGRGADGEPLTVVGLPLRPQDVAIGAALLATLLTLSWSRARALATAPGGRRTLLLATAVFLGAGLLALGVGLVVGQEPRDVFRDVRWWVLYAAAALAVLAGVSRTAVLRGLLLGAVAFALVVVVTVLLPTFDGGLKASTLLYDRGTLRMQFGNSIYLLPALAYATWVASRRMNATWLGLVLLLFGAQVLSLTRTSLLVSVAVILAILAWRLASWRPRRFSRRLFMAGASILAVLVIAFFGAVTASNLGTPRTAAEGAPPNADPEDPLSRITFFDDQSGLTVIVESVASGGRFATYLNALHEITPRPVFGGGMGQLVKVAFAYNPTRAYTIGQQPGVDNAALTVALKAGAIGVAAFGGLILLPLLAAIRPLRRHLRAWFMPAWVGVLALTVTQSFAVTGYGPYGIGLVLAIPFLGYAASRMAAARDQR
jgi:O-antigen ligase/polysaccharide polymerase Wzy-like membrane protein